MPLSDADRVYLEDRFDKQYRKVEELATEVFNLRLDYSRHVAAPCRGVKEHEATMLAHNPLRFWALIASIVAVLSSIVALFVKVIVNGGMK